jgi:hypothetical protein
LVEVIVALTLLLSNTGYTQQEIKCTMNLVKAESNFNLHSRNSSSGAYGLFQILNIKKKMSMKQQVVRFDKYVNHRYSGDACKAWSHQKLKKWY